MKRLFLLFVLITSTTASICAQSLTNERLSMTFDVGAGVLLGNSNLSSYGADYQKNFNCGLSANIEANYKIKKDFLIGAKFNLFTASENLGTKEGESIAEDVQLYYIAPQVGFSKKFAKSWHFDWLMGGGYMHYNSKSQLESNELKCNKGFFGANFDLNITRHLFKHIYLGAGVSFMGGNTSELKTELGNTEQTVKLNDTDKIKMLRADFTLSIKCIL